ncbi:MAG: bifunctional DNA primase/polymerase [Rhodospirillales bacterium]|nr:bifunctional DNA primase/polymerase [Rhodospirillales bacterium]
MTAPAAPGGAAPSAMEAGRLAQNLARNTGWPVFPCSWKTKRPTRPAAEGGAGYKDASTDPDQITELWRHWPGALIGMPTGPLSGVSVLDVDVKHDAARAWWIANEIRLPTTRTYRTRGGGLHLYFRHAPGVRNIEGKPISGVDVRGEGGYVIFWYGAGFECVDHAPPAPWPHWLTPFFWPPPEFSRRRENPARDDTAPLAERLERIKTRAIDMARSAAEGQKHDTLRNAALLLGGIQHKAGFSDAAAIGWLLKDLPDTVEDWEAARKTAAWGLKAGRAKPLDTGAAR